MLCFAGAAIAAPAPPPNDNRANATALGQLPTTVTGTTVGATVEGNEPGSCAGSAGSVWYSLSTGPAPPSRIGIVLSAHGDLDAVVDVYQKQRSQISGVICRTTDSSGNAALAFSPAAGATYLIRVAQLSDSASGAFSMRVIGLPGQPSLPGPHFGPRGASGFLDGTLYTQVLYSSRLEAGITYRLNLFKPAQGCMRLSLFPPGTSSLDSTPFGQLSCAGYRLFTPRVSGVWSFLIEADPNNRGAQYYSLHVAPASSKELVPGVFVPNLGKVTGVLNGRVIDDVRLYRFDVVSYSDLTLFLQTAFNSPFDLKLLDDKGHYLQCNCGSKGEETIRRQITPGTYYAVVQAEGFGVGQFTLSLQVRTITHVNVTFDKRGFERVPPGHVIQIAAHVKPAVSGPVTIEVDFFDPVERWQFYHYYRVMAVNGTAVLSFLPPHIGYWRASLSFDGTSTAAPATSGVAQAYVSAPLTPTTAAAHTRR
jgi:hypothetical protein